MSLIITRNFKRAKAQDAAATDAKFKKGDKVVSVKTGAQGVVNEVYGEEKYAVLFNGAANPDRVEGFQIRLADNSRAADDAEEIAHDSEIVALWQVLGDAKAYLREGKKNHNVKNVLAAAIKAAEKEDPNDRSVAEAKKVLAQFDSVEANDACGKGEDAKNDFANRIMPLVRKIADAQKVIEGVLSEADEIGYEAAHGEFPDSTFAKRSANQLEAECYEAVTALRKVKTIAVL